MKRLSFVVFALCVLCTAVFGDTNRIDQRQQNQDARIDAGVAAGQLNATEQKRLEAGENRIQRAEDRAKADGNVGAGEARRIERMENRESRKIQRLRNNRR